MVAKAPNLIVRLAGNILFICVGSRRPNVGEHKVLPYHNSEFVADLVKLVGLVISAAPDANHIHVRVAGRQEVLANRLRLHARGEAIEGNDICALGENGNAIDNELERPSPLIWISA